MNSCAPVVLVCLCGVLRPLRSAAPSLVVAGAETTGYLLGNLIDVLVSEDGLYDKVRADRALIRNLVEESLRRDGPVQRLHRVAMDAMGASRPVGSNVGTRGDLILQK